MSPLNYSMSLTDTLQLFLCFVLLNPSFLSDLAHLSIFKIQPWPSSAKVCPIPQSMFKQAWIIARVLRTVSSLWCVFVAYVCCSRLIWYWLYEHAGWLWEFVFILPPDQFQRKLPAAIPWPGPHPLLSAGGLPPSVQWLVASRIPVCPLCTRFFYPRSTCR